MVKPIAALRTMTGTRRTSPTDVARVLVEAYHNIADGEIDRVEFSINGGADGVLIATTRAIWYPDDSTYTDPLPGNWGGGPAPLWCFGVELLMSSYPVGTLTVTPTVYPTVGEPLLLDDVVIYNDRDGGDRRPTNKEVYWDYVGGNDANSGLASGEAVQTLQKALELVATSNDCGGGIIYIDAEGVHLMRTYSLYMFGSNLFTGGHHWVTITPRAGLSRTNVRLARYSTFDGDWITFAGTGGSQSIRLKISNVRVDAPGFVVSSAATITPHIWLEHVEYTCPDPFNVSPGAEGLFIRAWDYVTSKPVTVNNAGPTETIYATSCHIHHVIYQGIANRVRGCLAEKLASVAIQLNEDNEAFTNYRIEDIYQNYGVSGYFSAITSSDIRIDDMGSTVYRIQAEPTYVGDDFSVYAQYLSGSSALGLKLESWPTAGNDKTLMVISGGYSGGNPYIEVTGSLVAETASSSIIRPGSLATAIIPNSTWEVLVHSDIIQYNGPVENTILSNISVFRTWQSQGIFDASHDLSGAAIVNLYDGHIIDNPNQTTVRNYVVGALRHFIMRNVTIGGQWEADSTQTLVSVEHIDNAYSGFTAFAGTTAAFAAATDMRYNHFMQAGQAVGNNTTVGAFFSSATPSIGEDARVSVLSTASGSASALWSIPTDWTSNSRGAWDNVALGDWTITQQSQVSVTASGQTVPLVVYETPQLYAVSTIVILDTDSTAHMGIFSAGTPSITLGTAVSVTPANISPRFRFSTSNVQGVNTTNVPIIIITTGSAGTASTAIPNLGQTQIQIPNVDRTFDRIESLVDQGFFTSHLVNYDRTSIYEVLKELRLVNFDVTKLSANSKEIWESVIQNSDSSISNRQIIELLTNNYQNFTSTKNNIAGKFIIPRKRF